MISQLTIERLEQYGVNGWALFDSRLDPVWLFEIGPGTAQDLSDLTAGTFVVVEHVGLHLVAGPPRAYVFSDLEPAVRVFDAFLALARGYREPEETELSCRGERFTAGLEPRALAHLSALR